VGVRRHARGFGRASDNLERRALSSRRGLLAERLRPEGENAQNLSFYMLFSPTPVRKPLNSLKAGWVMKAKPPLLFSPCGFPSHVSAREPAGCAERIGPTARAGPEAHLRLVAGDGRLPAARPFPLRRPRLVPAA